MTALDMDRFRELSKRKTAAHDECAKTYQAWNEACRKLREIEKDLLPFWREGIYALPADHQ